MKAECCRTCGHYKERTEMYGNCRRRAPVVVAPNTNAVFPLVSPGDCCGEHTEYIQFVPVSKSEYQGAKATDTCVCNNCAIGPCKIIIPAGLTPDGCIIRDRDCFAMWTKNYLEVP